MADVGDAGKKKAAPAVSSAPKTGPVPSAAPKTGPATTGRRPLVSKEAKEQRAAAAAAYKPFYARIPRWLQLVLAAVVVLAVLVPLATWGYGAYQRSRNPEETAVRKELYEYRFDDDQKHLATLDAMGPKSVEIAIKLLLDRTPAETSNSHSSTTAGELSMMYLMHYAKRVNVPAPPKAVDADRVGLPTLKPDQWVELQQVWRTWFADVQAKGLALK